MAGTAWLDLPFMELTKENVRAEAARRGLPFRKLMELYYQHDHERAVHLSMYWRVVWGLRIITMGSGICLIYGYTT